LEKGGLGEQTAMGVFLLLYQETFFN